MAQNPIPGLSLPGRYDPASTPQNSQALQIWSRTVSPRMLGVGSPIFSNTGAAPPTPPTDAYLAFRGLVAVTFSGGSGTLTLPVTYPNGWLSLQMNGVSPMSYTTSGATINTVAITVLSGATGSIEVDVDAVGW